MKEFDLLFRLPKEVIAPAGDFLVLCGQDVAVIPPAELEAWLDIAPDQTPYAAALEAQQRYIEQQGAEASRLTEERDALAARLAEQDLLLQEAQAAAQTACTEAAAAQATVQAGRPPPGRPAFAYAEVDGRSLAVSQSVVYALIALHRAGGEADLRAIFERADGLFDERLALSNRLLIAQAKGLIDRRPGSTPHHLFYALTPVGQQVLEREAARALHAIPVRIRDVMPEAAE